MEPTTVILYHQVAPGVDCPDGIVAAWVASRARPDAQIIGRTYNDDRPLPQIPPGSELILVDYSVGHDQIRQWENEGHTLTIIDHHKNAMEALQSLENLVRSTIHFDLAHCGATLAWKVFRGDNPPAFLTWVRSRDLWLDCDLFDDPISETLLFHEWHGIQRGTLKPKGSDDPTALFDWYDDIATWDYERIRRTATQKTKASILRKREIVWGIAHRAMSVSVAWLPGAAAVTVPFVGLAPEEDRFCSDVAALIYSQVCPDCAFVVLHLSDGAIALRSDRNGSDWDVSKIARAQGGNGHRNAAGFKPPAGWSFV